MNLLIRRFREMDRIPVVSLHVKGLKETESYIRADRIGDTLNQDLRDIKGVYLENKGEFLVALVNDRIIGMGALKRVSFGLAEIKRLRVASGYRRRGFGRIILNKLIERAEHLGYPKLILITADKQTAAQSLYRSRGFNQYKETLFYGQKLLFFTLDLK